MLETEIKLAGKADLVDGKVPAEQLPSGGSGDMTKAVYDSDANGVIEAAQLNLSSKADTSHNHTGVYEPAKGSDDNFVTNAEKVVIGNTSGANTGDTSGHTGLQATLVSATNIKTINSTTLLGSGDLPVQAVLVSATNIKTINSASVLGSGDLVVTGSPPSWYSVLYSNQNDCNPNEVFREWNMLAVTGPTPTGITVSLSRAVMFTPPANMTCIKVRLFGVGITTNLYKFAIYPVGEGSAKLWDSGTVTTAANTWLNIVTNFTIVSETKYWFCVTAVAVGTVAGFRSMPSPLGTNFWGANVAPIGNRALSIPVFVQFAVSTGVFPATLPAIAAAAYANGTTGSVPFALLDSVA